MTAIAFSRQNDAGSFKHTTKYWENLLLVVVLVLGLKDLYWEAIMLTFHRIWESRWRVTQNQEEW